MKIDFTKWTYVLRWREMLVYTLSVVRKGISYKHTPHALLLQINQSSYMKPLQYKSISDYTRHIDNKLALSTFDMKTNPNSHLLPVQYYFMGTNLQRILHQHRSIMIFSGILQYTNFWFWYYHLKNMRELSCSKSFEVLTQLNRLSTVNYLQISTFSLINNFSLLGFSF